MARTILLFPGQGSQAVGMGKELAASEPAARAVFARADEVLGFSLSGLCFEGPAEDLTLTKMAQPALLTHSLAVLAAVEARCGEQDLAAAAGHSLGEWTALVAAGSIAFEDAVLLVHLRGTLMQEAVPEGEGAMAAVIGLDPEAVAAVCDEAAQGQVVVPATINGGGHVVISGHAEAVERAGELARGQGALKVLPVDVSAPFHSPLMQPVAEPLREAVASVTVSDPKIPVCSTVTGGWLKTAADVREALDDQLTQPVLWEPCIRTLAADGEATAWVVGAGATLGRMTKRLRVKGLRVKVVAGPDDIE